MQFNLLPNWNGYTRVAHPNLTWDNLGNRLLLNVKVELKDSNDILIRTVYPQLVAENSFIVDARTGLAATTETPVEYQIGEYDFLISLFGNFETPTAVSLFEIIKQYLLRNEARLVPYEYAAHAPVSGQSI